MSERYQVTYLLSLSTLPARFYALVYGLTGRAVDYRNPGVSLRSFIISRCVGDEITTVNDQVQAVIRECEEFSSSTLVLKLIVDSLIKSATEVVASVTGRSHRVQLLLVKDVIKLRELSQNLKVTYDAFLSIQDPGSGKLDLFTMPGVKLKQCTFDLQGKIKEITEALDRASVPPEVA